MVSGGSARDSQPQADSTAATCDPAKGGPTTNGGCPHRLQIPHTGELAVVGRGRGTRMKASPFLVGALVLAIAACSSGADLGDQQALAGQSSEPTRTLAVASPAPTATAKPKATPKAKATSKP